MNDEIKTTKKMQGRKYRAWFFYASIMLNVIFISYAASSLFYKRPFPTDREVGRQSFERNMPIMKSGNEVVDRLFHNHDELMRDNLKDQRILWRDFFKLLRRNDDLNQQARTQLIETINSLEEKSNETQSQLFSILREASVNLSRNEMMMLLKAHMPRHHQRFFNDENKIKSLD